MKLLTWFERSAGGGDGGGSSSTSSEPELVALARSGDQRAFDRLSAVHIGPLRGFLSRRVSSEAVDDVVQETLLAAWTALPNFEPRVQFKTWLYRIALHKAADQNRVRERRSSRETPLDMEAPDKFSSDDWCVVAERRDTITRLLAQLSPVQREVLELYYYAELTLPEIADLTRRNLSAIKYQFYAAHASASKAMADNPSAYGTDNNFQTPPRARTTRAASQRARAEAAPAQASHREMIYKP